MKTFSALPLLPSPLSKEGGLWEDTSIPMPQEKLKIEKHWHFVLLQPLSLSHLLLPSFSFFFFFAFIPNALLLLQHYTKPTFYTPKIQFSSSSPG